MAKLSPKCSHVECSDSVYDGDMHMIDKRAPRYCLTHSRKIDSLLREEDVNGIRAFYVESGFWEDGHVVA